MCNLQAHAWVTLGKLCLVDEALAKKSVHSFVQHLHSAEAPAVGGPSPSSQSTHQSPSATKHQLALAARHTRPPTLWSPALQVRNNVMVALADLCMQYTALVDGHVPTLAACLSDPHELVRRQGLALLANLLSKARPWPLFSRTLSLLDGDMLPHLMLERAHRNLVSGRDLLSCSHDVWQPQFQSSELVSSVTGISWLCRTL